jgi:flagellar hook assembly protein FlgD
VRARIDSFDKSSAEPDIVEIKGIARDENFLKYDLFYKHLDTPGADWEPIITSNNKVEDGLLARWYVGGLPAGEYSFLLLVEDKAGNLAKYEVCPTCYNYGERSYVEEVSRPGSFRISELEGCDLPVCMIPLPSPNPGPDGSSLFSPNGDQLFDTTRVSYALSEDATLTLKIWEATNSTPPNNRITLVREMFIDEFRASAVYSDIWDGKGDRDVTLSTGVDYVYTGVSPLPPLPDGLYSLIITNSDASWEYTHMATIDTAAPSANITEPVPGSRLKGIVDVTGTVSDLHLYHYRLLIRAAGETNWQPVKYSQSAGEDDTGTNNEYLFSFDTTEYSDGAYELMLKAVDRAGNEFRPIFNYIFDNTAPNVSIASPVDGDTVFSVFGASVFLEDTDIFEIVYELKADGEVDWIVAGTSSTGPDYSIQIDSADYSHGYHDLRAKATDLTGHIAYSEPINILIDKLPPVTWISEPENYAVLESGTVTITASSDDTDISSIKLEYRTASDVNWTLIKDCTEPPYVGTLDTTTLSDGQILLRSVGTDKSGLTEPFPGTSVFIIDNTPPTISIVSPAASGTIGGNFEITGVVFDENLLSYRVEYSPAGAGEWTVENQVIDASNVNGTISYINTATIVGGNYDLRVTATDKAYNTNSSTVPVLVQNLTPQLTNVSVVNELVTLHDLSPLKSVDINYTLTEDAYIVTLEVFNSAGELKRVLSGLPGISGTHQYTYDCMDSSAAYILSDSYTVKVTAADPFGNQDTGTTTFTVDSLAPVINVTYPTPASTNVYDKIDVLGTIDEDDIDSYSIYYAPADDPANLFLAGEYFQLPDSDVLGAIRFVDLEGDYIIKLTAIDNAGNEADDVLIPVTVHDSSSPMKDISLPTPYISTYSLPISFNLTRDADIEVNIYLDDVLQRNVFSDTITAGTYVDYQFDLNYNPADPGTPFADLADDRYTVKIQVIDFTLTAITSVHNVGAFTIDTVAPVVNITAPSGVEPIPISDDVTVTADVTEVNFQDYRLAYDPGDVEIATGTTEPAASIFGILQTEILLGDVTIKLTVTDLAGNSTTDSVIVNVNTGSGGVVSALSIDPIAISPNTNGTQDGNNDFTTIRFFLSETELHDVTLTVVKDVDSQTVKTFTATSASGQQEFIWNGDRDSDGAYVAEGTYTILLNLNSTVTGTHVYDLGTVIVDNTDPVFTITDPSGPIFDTLPVIIDTVPVIINLTEDYFSSYTVNLRRVGDPYPDPPVKPGNYYSPGQPLYNWDTRLSSFGPHDVQVNVTDLAGNSVTHEITVQVENGNLPVISNVGVSESIISPNIDGKKDSTSINFTIYRDMQLTAVLKDDQGTVVHTFVSNTLYSANDYALLFDGVLSTTGEVADSGVYTYEISVVDPLRGGTTTSSGTITVDIILPVINITSPLDNAYSGSTFDLTGTLTEDNLNDFTLSYDQAGANILTDVDRTALPNFTESIDAGIDEGAIVITLKATDTGENESTAAITVNIDNNPPIVAMSLGNPLLMKMSPALSAPSLAAMGIAASQMGPNLAPMSATAAQTAIIGGTIPLYYTGTDNNIQSVTILYEDLTLSPGTWDELYQTNTNAENALYQFDTTLLGDGPYNLKITAVDKANNSSSTDPISIELDNTPPDVSVTAPIQDQVILDTIDITGSVTDTNFFKYNVKIGEGASPTAYNIIRTYTAEVTSGVLHNWEPPIAESPYILDIEAIDIAGNVTSSTVAVTIDTIKPAPPAGLSVALDGNNDPVLTWTMNTESDFDHYDIYRETGVIGTLTASEITSSDVTFTDIDGMSGMLTYHVIALDVNGNQSDPSETVSIEVDKAGPTVIITSPNVDGSYGGVVDVQGTASSYDFYSYDLDITPGIADQNSVWTNINSSSVAKVNQSLGSFDSTGYSDGIVTLRLSALDTFGNLSETLVEADIDNTPPAQPTGFTAIVPAGTNNIDFTWDANLETDLAGYYLYLYGNRYNDQVFTVTAHTYSAAPDGDYEFTLVAVDEAGNESIPATPVDGNGDPITVITIENGTPSLTILTPASGVDISDVSEPTLVSTQLNDNDIAVVQFELGIFNTGTSTIDWSDIGVVFPEEYGTPDNPVTLGTVGVLLDLSTYSDETYYLRAIATDKNSNTDPAPAESTFNLKVPPTVPTALAAVVTGSTVSLTWDASSDPNGVVTGYYAYKDGTQVPPGTPDTDYTGTTFTENNLVDGVYSYAVSSYDENAYESSQSASVTATVDVTLPVVALTSPSGISPLNGTINIAGTVTELNPDEIKIELEGTSLPGGVQELVTLNDPLATTFSHSLDTSGYDTGDFTVKVTATDAHGNISVPATVAIIIDNEAPPIPPGLTGNALGDGTVELTWTAVTDPNGYSDPVTYNVYYKESTAGPYALSTSSVTSPHIVSDNLTLGTMYSFVVTAVDTLGNESTYTDLDKVDVTPAFTDDPRVPVIYSPTVASQTYFTGNPAEDIYVFADPTSAVTLKKGTEVIDTVYGTDKIAKSFLTAQSGVKAFSVAPNGKYSAIATNYSLLLLDNETGIIVTLPTSYAADPDSLAFSPDSKKIVYIKYNGLKVFDLTTWEETILNTADTMTQYEAAWSSDSTRLATRCYSDADAQHNIYIYDLAGGAPVQYTFDAAIERNMNWSPDDTKIVYDDSTNVFLLDLTLDPPVPTPPLLDSTQGVHPVFSPDGVRVVFSKYNDIYVKNITEGMEEPTLFTVALPDNVTPVKWLPSGKELIYAHDEPGTNVETLYVTGYDTDLEAFTTTTQMIGPLGYIYPSYVYGWMDDGRVVLYSNDGKFYTYNLPGRFVFKSVQLDVGDNIFTAYATNPVDTQSAESDPVTITYDTAIPPDPDNYGIVSDLFVMNDRLFFAPNEPVTGKEVLIQATVKNDSADVADNVIVNLKVKDSAGDISQIGEDIIISSLAADEEKEILFNWTPQLSGDHEVIITIDPYDTIIETDEDNNALIRSIGVNISTLATDILLTKNIFTENEDMAISLNFSNLNNAQLYFDYTLTIEDGNGAFFSTITSGSEVLAAYLSKTEAITWNTQNVVAGDHVMRLEAFDNTGTLISDDTQAFTVQDNMQLTGSISLASSYVEGSAADLSISISNSSMSQMADNVDYDLIITDPVGAQIFSQSDTIPSILMGSSEERVISFTLPVGTTGTHQATLKVSYQGATVDTVTANFEVAGIGDIYSATGSVTPLSTKIGTGDTISFDYSITNASNVNLDATNATAAVEIVSISQGLVIETVPISVNALPTDTITGTVASGPINDLLENYVVLLTITFTYTDPVEGAVVRREILDQSWFELGDVAPPAITLLSPGAAHLKGNPLDISAQVTDNVTGVSSVEYMIEGKVAWTPLPLTSGNNLDGVYSTSVDTSTYLEGDYNVSVRAVDLDGNDYDKLPADLNPVSVTVNVFSLSATGSVTPLAQKIGLGDTISFDYSITNTSSILLDASNAAAAVEIVSTSRPGLVIETIPISINISPAATAPGTVTSGPINDLLENYDVILTITFTEPAQGGGTTDRRVDLDQSVFELGDVIPPAITILAPGTTHLKETTLDISAQVTDDVTGVSSVEYMIEGKVAWTPLPLTSGDNLNGTYSTSVDTSSYAGGAYNVSFRAADLDGNDDATLPADSNPVTTSVYIYDYAATGSVTPLSTKIGTGDTISFDYSITNTGNVDLDASNATVAVEIVSTSRPGLVIETIPISINLLQTNTMAGVATSGPINDLLENYDVILAITFTEQAPAGGTVDRRVDLDQSVFELGDVAPPALTILSTATSHYRGDPFLVEVQVTDNIKGVQTVEYMIEGMTAWTALPLLSGDNMDGIYSSTVDTNAYDPAIYNVTFRAVDNDGNDDTTLPSDPNPVTISVDIYKIVDVTLSASLFPVPRVLAWANDPTNSSDTDTYDQTYPDDLQSVPLQVRLCLKALQYNGFDFKIVQRADYFLDEMRTGYYNIFIISDNVKQVDEESNISTVTEQKAIRELMELVNAGATAIISDHMRFSYDAGSNVIPDAPIEELTGAQYVDIPNPQDFTANISATSFTSAFTELIYGRVLKLAPTTATVFGYNDRYDEQTGELISSDPGAMINDYGNGRVITLAFNISKSAQHITGVNTTEIGAYEQLLLDSIQYLAPLPESQFAGNTVSFVLDLEVFTPSTLKFEVTVPPGSANIVPYGSGVLNGDVITWENTYNPGDTDSLEFTLTMPMQTGMYNMINITYLNDGQYIPLETLTLELDLTDTHTNVINEGMNMIAVLTLPPEEEATRDALIASLSTIAGTVTTDPVTIEQLIADLLSEIDTLRTLSADITQVRLKLDYALMILQGKM